MAGPLLRGLFIFGRVPPFSGLIFFLVFPIESGLYIIKAVPPLGGLFIFLVFPPIGGMFDFIPQGGNAFRVATREVLRVVMATTK